MVAKAVAEIAPVTGTLLAAKETVEALKSGFAKEVTKTGERLGTYAFDNGKFIYLKR